MHDPAPRRLGEGREHAQRDLGNRHPVQGPVLCERLFERRPANEVHDHVGRARRIEAEVSNSNRMSRLERGGSLRLGLEPHVPVVAREMMRVHDLERHFSVEVDVPSLVDAGEAPFAEERVDAIPAALDVHDHASTLGQEWAPA